MKPFGRKPAQIVLLAFTLVASSEYSYARDPEIRVGLSAKCPASGASPAQTSEVLPAAIAAALLAGLVQQAVGSTIDKINTYLTTPGVVSLQRTYPGDDFLTTNAKGAEVNPGSGCVWVAVADSFKRPTTGQNDTDPSPPDDPKVLANMKALIPFEAAHPEVIIGRTGATAPLLVYFEGIVEMSHDGTRWRIIPEKWVYPKFLHSSNLFQSSAHDAALTIEWANPGQETSPFAKLSLVWTAKEEGAITDDVVLSETPGWMPLPTVADLASKKGGFYPVNVTAQFVETRKPNVVAGWIGGTLTSKKTDLETSAGDKTLLLVSGKAQDSAAVTATTDATTAFTGYQTAYKSAKAALDTYNTAKGTNDPVQINQAKTAALLAYQTLAQAQNTASIKLKASGITFEPSPALAPIS
jgi:hypothetical protein